MTQQSCPYCSAKFERSDDFCPICGWYLNQPPPSETNQDNDEITEARIFLSLSSHEKFRISKTRTTLGRDMGDIVLADDLELSRLHCEFIYREHKLYVKDLESHNGVILGDRRIPPNEEIPLQPDDMLKIGANIFTIEFKSDEGTGEDIGGLSYSLVSSSDDTEYQLRLGENLVGRSEFAHVRIQDAPYVAREHAVISVTESSSKLGLIEIKIMDKGSTNGTTVNEVQIPPYKWKDVAENDEIGIADKRFKLLSKPR